MTTETYEFTTEAAVALDEAAARMRDGDIIDEAELAPGGALPARPPQPAFDGMEAPRLWPDIQGWRVDRVQLGLTGGVALVPFAENDRSLAARVRKLGSEVAVTVRAEVRRVGHRTLKKDGDVIGLDGFAALEVKELIGSAEAMDEVHDLRYRVSMAQEAINGYLEAATAAERVWLMTLRDLLRDGDVQRPRGGAE